MPGAAIRAGDLKDRYTFERQALDDNGDRLGAWGADAYTCAANTAYLHGTEAVQQQRLQGLQPVILTVWSCAATRQITTGWRAVDARDPTRVAMVTASNLTEDKSKVQILATIRAGQANG